MIKMKTLTMTDDTYAIEQVAADFWDLVGSEQSYPSDLQQAITWALPINVEYLPVLRVDAVHDWSRRHFIPYRFPGRDRRLFGCLIAYRDNGIILLDAGDPPDEQLFTLAHELAHYLLDYHAPRRSAIAALGEPIRPVLDGLRPPTVEERMHALLARAPLGVMSHLMERPASGLPPSSVLAVEDRADRLAFEILAPSKLVLHSVPTHWPYNRRATSLTATLTTRYGLPAGAAATYARRLLERQGGPSFRDWLAGAIDP